MAEELEGDWDGDEDLWRKRKFQTLGYRDGLSAGKECSAQQGFNAGFRESFNPGFEWGVANGITSAFAALSPEHQKLLVLDENIREELKSLNSAISSLNATSYEENMRDLITKVKSTAGQANICYDSVHNATGNPEV